MNDQNKDRHAQFASAPGSPAAADDSPWDEVDSGPTINTDGPTFKVPSDVPSPITAAPPALPAAPPLPAIPGAPSRPKAIVAAPAAPRPVAAKPPVRPHVPPRVQKQPEPVNAPVKSAPPNDEWADGDDDEPTHQVPAQQSSGKLSVGASKASSQRELMAHQDAAVVVGHGAIGDEATVEVGPDMLARLRARGAAASSPDLLPLASGPAGNSGRVPAAAPRGQAPHPGEMGEPRPGAWRGEPVPNHVSLQPTVPAFEHTPAPLPPSSPRLLGPGSSGQLPAVERAYPPPGQHAGYVSDSRTDPTAQRARPVLPGQAQARPPTPWGGQQSGAMAPDAAAQRSRQVILLAVVTVVCVSIFIIGVYLFVTTRF